MSNLGRLHPKNLDVMVAKMEARLDGKPITEQGQECRDLIAKCEGIEEQIQGDALLSIKEAAERLGVSRQTLRNWEHTGKLVPHVKTNSQHRRYLESQINPLRKKQISVPEIILPLVLVGKLRELGDHLLSNFDDTERVTIIISQGAVDGKARVTIDSADGLTTICKTFNVEEE